MQITIQNETEFAKGFQLEGVSPPLYLGPQATAVVPPTNYLDYEPDFTRVATIKRPVDGGCRLMVDGQTVAPDALSKAFRDGHFGEDMKAKALALDAQRAKQVHPTIAKNDPPVPVN